MATNKEMISALKYNDSFRNALRNYYSYGFLCLRAFDKSRQRTTADDWERLTAILAQYAEWSYASGDSRAVMVATTDSQALLCNPFHEIYRYCLCNTKDAAYFFHMVAALSENVYLNVSKKSTEQHNEKEIPSGCTPELWAEALASVDALQLNQYKKSFTCGARTVERRFDPLNRDWNYMIRLAADICQKKPLTTSELMCFYPDGAPLFSGKNKKHKNRLEMLERYGYLHCIQEKGKNGGDGARSWELDKMTLGKLMEDMKRPDGLSERFEERFLLALDYYSRSFTLGELGKFLLEREGWTPDKSPFRFKHDYFMQSVNDFNLVDLLYCIEQKKWCVLDYRHGTDNQQTVILCYPLETRISTMTGREFLMCYEPFMRSCISLRIDFIESTQEISDKDVKEILNLEQTTDMDIERCRTIISRTWGVSTGTHILGNAAVYPDRNSGQISTTKVTLEIEYDREKEYWINERIERERRFGKWDPDAGVFEVDVMDPGELRPWIRGLYSRIRKCSGMDTGKFSIRSDVKDITDKLLHSTFLTRRLYREDTHIRPEIPYLLQDRLLKTAEPVREHDKIFNETEGIYCHLIADVLAEINKEECGGPVSVQELESIIQKTLGGSKYRTGKNGKDISAVSHTLTGLLRQGGLLFEENGMIRSKYCSNSDIGIRTIIPMNCLMIYFSSKTVEKYRNKYSPILYQI